MDFARYSHVVKRYLLNLTQNYEVADDLTQETLLRAIRHSEQLNEMDDPRGWLFRVACNLWRDQLRKRKRRPAQQPLVLEIVSTEQAPESCLEQQERIKQVLDHFQTLPDMQRQVIYLRTIESLSIEEIATVLDLTANAVKSNLSHARKKMRQKLFQSESAMPDRSAI